MKTIHLILMALLDLRLISILVMITFNRHILEKENVRYQGLTGRIKKFRLMEIKIKVNLITEV